MSSTKIYPQNFTPDGMNGDQGLAVNPASFVLQIPAMMEAARHESLMAGDNSFLWFGKRLRADPPVRQGKFMHGNLHDR